MAKTFEQAIEGFAKFPEKVVRGTLLSMGSKIIERSPVGNPSTWKKPKKGYVGGRFRNNWQFSFNSPAAGTVQGVDPNGSKASSQLKSAVDSFDMGQTFYMTNNLPYAVRLEFGWSKQAPQGMVRIVVAQYEQAIREAAAKL